MRLQRSAGVLLHPTSLPGLDGIGDVGPQAYRWIDWLAATGCTLWQVLPLGPTGYGDSPYQCFSAFAGNPFLVSPGLLLQDGLLTADDLDDRPAFPANQVDFGPVIDWKLKLLDRAYERYLADRAPLRVHQSFEIARRHVRFGDGERRHHNIEQHQPRAVIAVVTRTSVWASKPTMRPRLTLTRDTMGLASPAT